jgi:endonuclease III
MGKTSYDWDRQIGLIRKRMFGSELPSVSKIASQKRDPFKVLVSTIISLRTKDEVTSAASERLFALAGNPKSLLKLSENEVAKTIYPAGFYRQKAGQIKKCCNIIENRHRGKVPDTLEELLELPGVGLKTANLTLNLGFGIEAICVDTHVHRISNRLGWVVTKTPDATEAALSDVLPKRYWIEINGLLVSFGKTVCTPVSPFCSTCPLQDSCPRKGVTRSR